jgi:hypothetical protein
MLEKGTLRALLVELLDLVVVVVVVVLDPTLTAAVDDAVLTDFASSGAPEVIPISSIFASYLR